MQKKWKYELLLGDTIPMPDGTVLYRIRALRDFGYVKTGDLGGYIAGGHNLSHEGTCWVGDEAKVYGNAKVCDDAWVFGNAQVFDDAKVYGDARIYGNAKVFGGALVFDDAKVYGDAWVFDDAKIYGEAQIYGNAGVFGKAKVYGDAQVLGHTKVCGHTAVSGTGREDSSANTGTPQRKSENFKLVYSKRTFEATVKFLIEHLGHSGTTEDDIRSALSQALIALKRKIAAGGVESSTFVSCSLGCVLTAEQVFEKPNADKEVHVGFYVSPSLPENDMVVVDQHVANAP